MNNVKVQDYLNLGLSIDNAIKVALHEAAKTGVYAELPSGEHKIASQVYIGKAHDGILGIIGNEDGTSKLVFDWPQAFDWDSNTNQTDPCANSGVVVEGLVGVCIKNFGIQYKEEFYRKGQTYFGSVSCLVMCDTSHSLVSNVNTSGANRNGIFFASKDSRVSDAASRFYKGALSLADLDNLEYFPQGNVVEFCTSESNRVAGIMYGWQKDFKANQNICRLNGHEADGGTGYGITAMAGSLNFGSASMICENVLERNFRKGLDFHDAVVARGERNIIKHNRLHGIAYENRQYPVAVVSLCDNDLSFDGDFILTRDDDLSPDAKIKVNSDYYRQSGIRVEIKQQPGQKWVSDINPVVTIVGNKISGIDVKDHANRGLYWAVEYRNNDQKAMPLVTIADNEVVENGTISSFIAIFAKNADVLNGLGNVSIKNNKFHAENCNSSPIYIEELCKIVEDTGRNIEISGNELTIDKINSGSEKIACAIVGCKFVMTGNTFRIPADMNRPALRFIDGNKYGSHQFSENEIVTPLAVSRVKSGYLNKDGAANCTVVNNKVHVSFDL